MIAVAKFWGKLQKLNGGYLITDDRKINLCLRKVKWVGEMAAFFNPWLPCWSSVCIAEWRLAVQLEI